VRSATSGTSGSAAEEHRITHSERRTEVRIDDHLSITESQHLPACSSRPAARSGSKSGQKIILEAGAHLPLKAGGSFVQPDAGSVTLVGRTSG